MKLRYGAGLLCLLFVLPGCLGGPRGDPLRGQQIFNGEQAGAFGAQLACVECHSTTPGAPSPLGPDLSGIGARAGAAVPGQPAADYLRQAILEPDAHLAGGFQEGIMPRNYRQILSDEQVEDLVAFLLTLDARD